jgi:hypothetical protein
VVDAAIHHPPHTFRLRLKQLNKTFRWEGLNPSTTLGIERKLSAIENRISSLFTNLPGS